MWGRTDHTHMPNRKLRYFVEIKYSCNMLLGINNDMMSANMIVLWLFSGQTQIECTLCFLLDFMLILLVIGLGFVLFSYLVFAPEVMRNHMYSCQKKNIILSEVAYRHSFSMTIIQTEKVIAHSIYRLSGIIACLPFEYILPIAPWSILFTLPLCHRRQSQYFLVGNSILHSLRSHSANLSGCTR